MTWHDCDEELLSLEIVAMFRGLAGAYNFDLLTESIYAHQLRERALDLNRRPRTTPYDRRLSRDSQRRTRERRMVAVVSIRSCIHCGLLFELTENRQAKARSRGIDVRSCGRDCAANHQKRAFRVEHDGLVLTIAEWCTKIGISRATFKSRRYRGLSVETALFAPVQTSKSRQTQQSQGSLPTPKQKRTATKRFKLDGQLRTLLAWSRKYRLPLGEVQRRIDAGWSLSDALGVRMAS